MRAPDNRPLLAVAGVAVLLLAAFAVPFTRGWLAESVVEPLQAQADPARGLRTGYTVASLAFWAALGGVLAWAAHELLFVRLALAADRRFLVALTPFLAFGPLFHALLVADAFPRGGLVAYLATEPIVYLTTAVLALAGFVVGHLARRPLAGPLVVGLVALAPLALLASTRASAMGSRLSLILLTMAVVSAVIIGLTYTRLRPREDALVSTAVIGAHALDGATTWMVLRDPFGLGFHSFSEQNPVSEALVGMSNGWPYFVVKLILPVGLLLAVRTDEGEEALRTFLLLAVFVLGYGPGMSNLLQVWLGS